jgi:mitotic spindle assembly checkpoint protein MAD2
MCNHHSSNTPSTPSCTIPPPDSFASSTERIESRSSDDTDTRETIHSFQRGVYPAEDFAAVKKYGLNMLVSSDDQVRAYIKKIMSQLDKWMVGGKISKLVIVITNKDTGEHVERWQFDVSSPSLSFAQPPFLFPPSPKSRTILTTKDKQKNRSKS